MPPVLSFGAEKISAAAMTRYRVAGSALRTCCAWQKPRSLSCTIRRGQSRQFATWNSTHPTLSLAGGAGLGMGNVKDRMLPRTKRNPQDPPLYKHLMAPHTVSIVGAPLTFGQPFVGVDNSPTLLRDAGLRNDLTSLGWRVHDGPDLELHSAKAILGGQMHSATTSPGQVVDGMCAKNPELVGRGTQIIAERVASVCREGQFPLVLGGDHSISMGSLAGILRERPSTGVLWVDAHADLNTPHTSESGNMHGMPLGMMVKGITPIVDYSALPGCEWLTEYNAPLLDPSSLVYIGLRDVDLPERRLINDLGILAFTMTDIDRYGIGRVMDMALEHLMTSDPDRPLHLSFDIDAVDPEHAPATGTAVRGGLTYREAHYVCESIASSGSLASADIVELNPSLSDDSGAEETVQLGLHLIASFMGKSII